MFSFDLLARETQLYKLNHIFLHIRPLVMHLYVSIHLCSIKMHRVGSCMSFHQYLLFNNSTTHAQSIFISNYTITRNLEGHLLSGCREYALESSFFVWHFKQCLLDLSIIYLLLIKFYIMSQLYTCDVYVFYYANV